MKKLSLYILGIITAGLLLSVVAIPWQVAESQPPEQNNALGASIPTVVALYTDSLASRISNSATSFTLTRGTDKQDRALSGYYGFVIDEGTASEEFFTATCSGTACTVVARGIDVQDGESQVSALKFEHRRGAVVKISNFPQLAILSRILNGQESASSTFMIGDGSTTTTLFKTIFNDNGTANKPFVRYNEATGRWQFSDDGISTTNFTTSSASGLSASSTAAVFVTDSEIGVFTSSTASLNGGYIRIGQQADGTYRLYFDSPSFLSTQQTFSNLRGTSTAFALGFSPTSSVDAANKGYVDQAILFGSATATAGEAITAGRALYSSNTSTVWHTNTSGPASSTVQFIGIAKSSASIGAEVQIAIPGSKACGLSSLAPGFNYYLNGTAGQLDVTPGVSTSTNRIGRALSSSCLQVEAPKFIRSGFFTVSGSGTTRVDLGFYPARVHVIAAQDGASSCDGMVTIGSDSNISHLAYDNAIQIANTTGYDTDSALYMRATGPVTCIDATITKDATGFSIVAGTVNGTSGISWTAFSE